jgi:hypothetical protein
LTTQFPGLSRHVRDDQGQIRQFLNVYLNEEDIRFLGGEECAVKEGDKVLLVPSIAGGSPYNAKSCLRLQRLRRSAWRSAIVQENAGMKKRSVDGRLDGRDKTARCP